MSRARRTASATVFMTGAAVLALELLAGRFMLPAFGASLFIWGAVLSVTLLCLALGYQWGGAMADRAAEPMRRLVVHILIAAGWIALVPLLGAPLLRAGIAAGAYLGPVLVAFGLFLVPLPLLATATPLAYGAIRGEVEGRPAGAMSRLWAISTAGSIAGAIATAYVLVPWLGLRRGFLITAAALVLTALPAALRGRGRGAALAVLATVLAIHAVPPSWRGEARFADGVVVLDRRDSPHGHLVVLDDRRDGSRILLIDGVAQSVVGGPDLADRTAYVEIIFGQLPRFRTTPGRALMLGLGAGSVARGLSAAGYRVDAVEIDAEVIEVARRFFRLRPDESEVHLADGRAALARFAARGERVDLGRLDAASASAHPEHIYNRDAYRELAKLLAPGGVLIVNLIAQQKPAGPLVDHQAASLAAVFAHVEAVARPSSARVDNIILFASDQAPRAFDPGAGRDALLALDTSARPLTDDWNPMSTWSIGANHHVHAIVRAWLGDASQLPW